MRGAIAGMLAVLATTTSCASPTSPGAIEAAAAAALPDRPDIYRMAQESVGPVEAGWVDRLGDPALSALVREAQTNNRDLQAASANVDRSRALARQAGASLTPQVSLNSGSSRSGDIDGRSFDAYSTSLQASWELDVWGRLGASEQAGILSVQAAEADYRFSQYSLAAAVARAYFLAIDAREQVMIVQDTEQALAEIVRITEVQNQFGLATTQDVALARSDMATATANLAAARGGQRDALRALEVLIGRYPSADIDVAATLPRLPGSPPAGLPSDLLKRRPDIVAAERRVAAAFRSLDAAEAAALPQIRLTGELGGTSGDLTNLLNPSNLTWMAASSLVSPLIDGGRIDGQIDEATADQKATVADYGQTVLDAFQEVEGGLDQFRVLRDQAASTGQAVDEARQALTISQLRYKEGEADLLEVLSIQQRLFSAQADFGALQRAQLDNWVDLNLSLGGDWAD